MFDDTMPGGGFGRGFGPGFFGHGGPGFGPQRFFQRGMIKYLVLQLIEEQPRHGYDIIQELEKQFHGIYNPSAGTVYPILQLLEDQDFIKNDQKEGKKVYSITSEGKKYLSEHKEEIDRIQKLRGHFKEHFGEELHELRDELREMKHFIFHAAKRGALKDPEKVKALRTAFQEFRGKLEVILRDEK